MNVLSAPPEMLDELLWDVREAMLGIAAFRWSVQDLVTGDYLSQSADVVHGDWWCRFFWPGRKEWWLPDERACEEMDRMQRLRFPVRED